MNFPVNDLQSEVGSNLSKPVSPKSGGRNWFFRIIIIFLVGLPLTFVVLAVQVWLGMGLFKLVATPGFDKDAMKANLVAASERHLRANLAKWDAGNRSEKIQQPREAAETAHGKRLARIEVLVAEYELLTQTALLTAEAREVLRILSSSNGGVEPALRYIESQQARLMASALSAEAAHNTERRRACLRPLLQAAQLHRIQGQTASARSRYEELLRLEPQWPEALEGFSWLLFDQSVHAKIFGTKADAEADAERCLNYAQIYYNQAPSTHLALRLLGSAHNQMGDVLSMRDVEADSAAILEHYERGLALSRAFYSALPNSPEAARSVAFSFIRLGEFLSKLGRPGDAERVLAYFESSLEINEKLLAENPDSDQNTRGVLWSLVQLRVFLSHRDQPGDVPRALAYVERQIEINEKLLAATPGNARAAGNLSLSLNSLGDLLVKRLQPGDAEQALALFERCLEIDERLLAENLGSAEAAKQFSWSLTRLGQLLAKRGQSGDLERALLYFERDLEVNEKVTDNKTQVSACLERLGDLLVKRSQPGDVERALGFFERSLKINEERLAANPGCIKTARDVANSLEGLGNLLVEREQPGDIESAIAYFMRDLEINEELLAANPGSSDAARGVFVIFNNLAFALTKRWQPGDAERALAFHERSLEISENLLASNPKNTQAIQDFSQSLKGISNLLVKRGQSGDVERALTFCERDLAMFEKLRVADPDDAQVGHDFSMSLARLGTFLMKRGHPGDLDRAVDSLKRCNDELEKQMAGNPLSDQAAHKVWVFVSVLGDALVKRGQPGDAELALASYERSLEISEKLLAAAPGSDRAAHNVSLSLSKLAEFFSQPGHLGDLKRSLSLYKRNLEISENLLATNPGDVKAARHVSGIYQSLAWTQLFAQIPADAEASSVKAVELNPAFLGPYTNLAHALLFQGKRTEAEAIYLKHKGVTYRDRLWEDVIKEDFQMFRKAGIDHADMKHIGKALGISQ